MHAVSATRQPDTAEGSHISSPRPSRIHVEARLYGAAVPHTGVGLFLNITVCVVNISSSPCLDFFNFKKLFFQLFDIMYI